MTLATEVRGAIRGNGLSGRALCVHSSLRSFGWVDGGPQTIIEAILGEGCTLLVPTFTDFGVDPPPHLRRERNGWDYDNFSRASRGTARRYASDTAEIDREMGALPAAVVRTAGRVRGEHPLCSFASIGPFAEELIAGQSPLHVCAPLEALAELDGRVVLMGVGLEAMTLLHLAEQQAGRNLFRRWALDAGERVIEAEVGGCSDGFDRLAPLVAHLGTEAQVGLSRWRILPARETLFAAAEAIRRDPGITHCGKQSCRCSDAVLGGPVLIATPEERSVRVAFQ